MTFLHILFAILLLGSWVMALYGYLKTRKVPLTPNAVTPSMKFVVINSAVLYALAYNLIFFIQELFLAWGKYWLGLKAYLYHNNHGWDGTHEMTSLMQGSGALAIFITGIVFMFLLFRKKNPSNWIGLFVFWMAYHGFMQSLPQVSSALVAPLTDVGRAMGYLAISFNQGLIWGTLSILLMIVLNLWLSKKLLEFAPQDEMINHPLKRFRFIFRIAVLPAIIGTIFIIPFRLPPWSQVIGPIKIMLISIPWILAFSWRIKSIILKGNRVNFKISILPILALIILLAIFQLILAKGVVFEP